MAIFSFIAAIGYVVNCTALLYEAYSILKSILPI